MCRYKCVSIKVSNNVPSVLKFDVDIQGKRLTNEGCGGMRKIDTMKPGK